MEFPWNSDAATSTQTRVYNYTNLTLRVIAFLVVEFMMLFLVAVLVTLIFLHPKSTEIYIAYILVIVAAHLPEPRTLLKKPQTYVNLDSAPSLEAPTATE